MFSAIHKTLEHDRPVLRFPKERRERPEIIANNIELGKLHLLREIRLVGMRNADFTPPDHDQLAGFFFRHNLRLHWLARNPRVTMRCWPVTTCLPDVLTNCSADARGPGDANLSDSLGAYGAYVLIDISAETLPGFFVSHVRMYRNRLLSKTKLPPDSPLASAKAANLRYVTGEGPGIVRKRRGKSFAYIDRTQYRCAIKLPCSGSGRW